MSTGPRQSVSAGWYIAAGVAVLVIFAINPVLGVVAGIAAVIVLMAMRSNAQSPAARPWAPPPSGWVYAETQHLMWAIHDLSAREASGLLGDEGRRLLGWYQQRLATLTGAADGPAAVPPPGRWAAAPQPMAPQRQLPLPPAQTFDMREFLTLHAILLLSYAGAVLLVTSTLLFILYGPEGIGGGGRAAAVGLLNAVLAAVAVASRRRERTRVISASYTAMAAVSLPLTLAAIYGYVVHGNTGMSVPAALALGGAACAAVYVPLSRALRSVAYASMSVAALAVAAPAAAIATDLGFVTLPAAALVATCGWWLAGTWPRPAGEPSIFAMPGFVLAAAATLAAPVAAGAAAAEGAPDCLDGPHPLYLPLTLGLVGAACGLRWWRARDEAWAWLGAALVSVVPWSAAWVAGGDLVAQSGALTATGAALGVTALLASGRLPTRAGLPEFRDVLAAGAGAYLLAATSLAAALAPQLAAVGVAAAAGAGLALLGTRRNDWAWSLLGMIVAVAGVGATVWPHWETTSTLPSSWPVLAPVGLGIGLAAVLVVAVVRRSEPLFGMLSLGLTGVVLTAVSAWHAGQAGYPIALVAQTAAQTALLPWLAPRLRLLAAGGIAARLVAAAAVVITPLTLEMGIAASIAAVAVALAVVSARTLPTSVTAQAGAVGALSGLAAAAAGSAWYWATALATGSALLGTETLAVSLGILAPVLLGIPVALLFRRSGVVREMAAGVGVIGAGAFVTSVVLSWSDADWTVLAVELAVTGCGSWAVAAALRVRGAALVAAAAAVLGGAVLAITTAVQQGIPQQVASLALLAMVLRLTVELEPSPHAARRLAVRCSAVGVAGAGVLLAVAHLGEVSPVSAAAHDPVPLAMAALLASLSGAGFLTIGGGRLERLAAIVVVGLSVDWVSVAVQATNVQAYVIAPGIAFAAAGLAVRSAGDRAGSRDTATGLLVVGLSVILGTSALQALAWGGWYVPWLLAEAVTVLVVAVATRSRTAAVAAGLAILGVCLRAVADASSSIPLYALFALGAGILLSGSLALALGRQQFEDARASVAAGWATWGA